MCEDKMYVQLSKEELLKNEKKLISDVLIFLKSIKKDFHNEDKIVDVIKSLYDYQQEALREAIFAMKGKITLPTGTGKTRIQAALIALNILMNGDKFEMYVINA